MWIYFFKRTLIWKNINNLKSNSTVTGLQLLTNLTFWSECLLLQPFIQKKQRYNMLNLLKKIRYSFKVKSLKFIKCTQALYVHRAHLLKHWQYCTNNLIFGLLIVIATNSKFKQHLLQQHLKKNVFLENYQRHACVNRSIFFNTKTILFTIRPQYILLSIKFSLQTILMKHLIFLLLKTKYPGRSFLHTLKNKIKSLYLFKFYRPLNKNI